MQALPGSLLGLVGPLALRSLVAPYLPSALEVPLALVVLLARDTHEGPLFLYNLWVPSLRVHLETLGVQEHKFCLWASKVCQRLSFQLTF